MVRVSNARSSRKYLDKRRAILRAAASAFREHGLQQTGMREIAAAADLSPANLYYYFGSKDEILYFCQDLALDRMLETCREATGAPPERLRRLIGAQVTCMLEELDGAAAHVAVDALPPELRARIVAKRDRYEREIRRVVEDGVRSKDFVSRDAALAARAILGAVNWTAQWYRPGGRVPPATIAREFADYLVRGLLR